MCFRINCWFLSVINAIFNAQIKPKWNLYCSFHLNISSLRQGTFHSNIHYFPRNHDVIKRKHFPRCWPFVRGIHRSPVNSLHKGQWRGALIFTLICAWINGWVNNRKTGDLRRHRTHYDVTVMMHMVRAWLCWGLVLTDLPLPFKVT